MNKCEIISFFKERWDSNKEMSSKNEAFKLYFYALKEYCTHYAVVCQHVNKITEGVLLETEQQNTLSEHLLAMNVACRYTRNFKAMLLEQEPEDTFPADFNNHVFGEEICKSGTALQIENGEIISGKENLLPEKLKKIQEKVTPDNIEVFEYTKYLQTLLLLDGKAVV